MTPASGHTVGQKLREAREARALSLEEIEWQIRVPAKMLLALEEGEYDKLPSLPLSERFVRRYARLLGLDAAALVEQLRQEWPGETRPVRPLYLPEKPLVASPPWLVWARRLAWLLAALLLLVLLLEVLPRFAPFPSLDLPSLPFLPGTTARPTATPLPPRPTPTPTPRPVIVRTATPTPTSSPTPARPSPTPTPSPTPVEGWVLEVETTGPAWVRVIADGEVLFEGTLPEGSRRRWEARTYLTLRTGNAGATRVTLNGEDLGPLGEAGEVVERSWGEAPPTATPAP